MKIIRYLLLTVGICMCLCEYSYSQGSRDILFQTSTINALLEGIYDGQITYKELKEHGDFGIGTFNNLDGEMIGLEGKFYQVKTDGIAYPVDGSMKTPFAAVTFFEPDKSALLDKTMNYEQLKQYLDSLLPTQNIFYAIKIRGKFNYIKARSVPRQEKPYPPLTQVVKKQSIFEFHQVEGTIVGIRSPFYVEGINVPGYHLHFITKDKKAGGHVLEFLTKKVKIEIDYTSEFYLVLPKSSEFYKLDLTIRKQKEVENIER
ncbi:acetolactate decarboxylase [Candidatus Aerophobetes bacterium]|nr:acetolactate decarboxylase [Candidatus Aerophobetes bacterium]